MKKTGFIVNVPYEKKKLEGLTADQKKLAHKSLKKHIKEIKFHFNEDGWDLDASLYYDEIFFDIFGFHLSDWIIMEIIYKAKLQWGTRTNPHTDISNTCFYIPEDTSIYYNISKNKLVITEDYRDLDQHKDYTYIGRL